MEITTIVDANLRLTQALINMLVTSGVLSKEQLATMLTQIIESDKAAKTHNAGAVEGLLKQMFVTA